MQLYLWARSVYRWVLPRWRLVNERLTRPLFNSAAWASALRREHVLVLGDSHVEVFREVARRRLLHHVWIKTCIVAGATAQGLVNPNSTTDALAIFGQRLSEARSWQTLVFQLGEVDCGFVIWYRAEKYDVPISTQLERSLESYERFLVATRSRGFSRIVVLSAPLPTIPDNGDWGPVANARREVQASQRERTTLTLRYNHALGEICARQGFRYVDLTADELDPESGLVRRTLLNPNRLDHHFDRRSYSHLVADGLKRAAFCRH